MSARPRYASTTLSHSASVSRLIRLVSCTGLVGGHRVADRPSRLAFALAGHRGTGVVSTCRRSGSSVITALSRNTEGRKGAGPLRPCAQSVVRVRLPCLTATVSHRGSCFYRRSGSSLPRGQRCPRPNRPLPRRHHTEDTVGGHCRRRRAQPAPQAGRCAGSHLQDQVLRDPREHLAARSPNGMWEFPQRGASVSRECHNSSKTHRPNAGRRLRTVVILCG